MVLTSRGDQRGVRSARILLAAAMAGVAWASLARPESLPREVALVSDKLLHAAGYVVLGVLAIGAGLRGIVAVVLLVSFGLLLEVAQLVSGYRSFEWADLLADAVGASLGVGAASTVRGASAGRRGE